MANLKTSTKFKGRAQDYLDWFKLGYETENQIVIQSGFDVLQQQDSYKEAQSESLYSEALPSYKKPLDTSYTKKYISQHLQDFQDVNIKVAASSVRHRNLDGLEDISTVGDTECGAKSEYSLEAEKAQVYLHYDFSKYDELSLKLPVNNWRKEILQKIDAYSVVVIQGETGCGKSTQVPQFILDNAVDSNEHVNIVVTQPRKIAAISLANRVCEERGWITGKLVGYQVGLNNVTDTETRISYVTTEVLVQKIIHKRSLNDYTHIILDEVHERDQHTDFALLVVKKLLHTVSKNVKIILMSATIDTDKFANYFSTPINGLLIPAPIINVSDKTVHKVQIFYLGTLRRVCPDKKIPLYSQKDPKISQEMYEVALNIVKNFDNIERQEEYVSHPKLPKNRGAVLIFVPGLFEIETMINLLKENGEHLWWECYPLHSTLTVEEQRCAFARKNNQFRKIIVSTNIAESSITVPDVKYVIDFCLTKVLHCDPVTNYTCLKIAWASQASCRQRAGRAGRVSAGRVYRLVEEDFYQDFDKYIAPELCRTPLTQVVLKTKLLDMGPPESLLALALDPPNLAEIYRTVLVLKQIGALGLKTNGIVSSIDGNLTYLGQVAARLPLDPHLSKLIVLGHIFGCLTDTIIIAASLSLKSFHSTPFQDELSAFFSKVSWAYSRSSDCFASLHAYQVWESFNCRGEFLPSNSSKEKKWAESSYIQIETLKEVRKLIEELTARLSRLKIKSIGREGTTINDDYVQIALKICIAGAFFPNYYKRYIPEDYEAIVSKELSNHDPFRTVIVSGLPSSNILYEEQLKELLKNCSEDIKIYYEDRKAYIEFPKRSAFDGKVYEIPGNFPTSMHMAIKMRQVIRMRDKFVLKIHSPEKTKELMSRSIIDGKPVSEASHLFETTRKITVQSHIKELKPPVMPLPGRGKNLWKVSVTHVEHPNQFWVTSDENDCLKNLTYLQSTIGLVLSNSVPLSPKHQIPQMLCLAPFMDGDGMEKYYRARIEKIIRNKSDVNAYVYFVDFGNCDLVSTSVLKEMPDALFETPILAIECSLSEIKPAYNFASKSTWKDECINYLNEKLRYQKFNAQIFSVVHNVIHLMLLDNDNRDMTVNEILIQKGYAVKAAESLLSKQNNLLRTLYGPEIGNRDNRTNLFTKTSSMSLDDRGDTSSNQMRIQRLRGPYSPLEMNFVAISRTGSTKGVRLDRNSVNSAALDVAPDTIFDRMIVSCFVVLNPSENSVTLRSTTSMPMILGMLPLCLLLFSPVAELRTNESKTAYTGALFGLGFDSETKTAVYPDDDIEVAFDFNFECEDLRQINQIRYMMSNALDDLEDLTDKSLLRIQKYLRDFIYRLLKNMAENHHYVKAVHFPAAYRWNQVNEEDKLHPVTQTGIEANENIVFPLHTGIDLKKLSKQQILLEKALQLNKLENRLRAEKYSISGQLEERCEICQFDITSFIDLNIHLQSKEHTELLTELVMDSESLPD